MKIWLGVQLHVHVDLKLLEISFYVIHGGFHLIFVTYFLHVPTVVMWCHIYIIILHGFPWNVLWLHELLLQVNSIYKYIIHLLIVRRQCFMHLLYLTKL